MKVIIDAMSGCDAPRCAVHGALEAMKQPDISVLLVGTGLPSGMETAEAETGVGPADSVTDVLLKHKHSSLLKSLELLAEGRGDALVTALSPEALLSGIALKDQACALLRQASDRDCPIPGAIAISSLEDTAVFLGRRLKKMLMEDKRLALRMLGSRISPAQLLQLSKRQDLVKLIRCRKPVILLPADADSAAFRSAAVYLQGARDFSLPRS